MRLAFAALGSVHGQTVLLMLLVFGERGRSALTSRRPSHGAEGTCPHTEASVQAAKEQSRSRGRAHNRYNMQPLAQAALGDPEGCHCLLWMDFAMVALTYGPVRIG